MSHPLLSLQFVLLLSKPQCIVCMLQNMSSSLYPVVKYSVLYVWKQCCGYICWVLSSSTDSSRSFIWFLSSSSWEPGSSLAWDAPSPLEFGAAGLCLASALATLGRWGEVNWDKVFVEGCGDKWGETMESQMETYSVRVAFLMMVFQLKNLPWTGWDVT